MNCKYRSIVFFSILTHLACTHEYTQDAQLARLLDRIQFMENEIKQINKDVLVGLRLALCAEETRSIFEDLESEQTSSCSTKEITGMIMSARPANAISWGVDSFVRHFRHEVIYTLDQGSISNMRMQRLNRFLSVPALTNTKYVIILTDTENIRREARPIASKTVAPLIDILIKKGISRRNICVWALDIHARPPFESSEKPLPDEIDQTNDFRKHLPHEQISRKAIWLFRSEC